MADAQCGTFDFARSFIGCVRSGQCRAPDPPSRGASSWEPMGDEEMVLGEHGERLIFVGEGRGSYHRSEVPMPAPMPRKPPVNTMANCVMAIVFALVVVGFLSLVASLASPPDLARFSGGARPTSAPAPVAPAFSDAWHEAVLEFDCSGSADDRLAWGPDRRRWCCMREGIGCAALGG